MHMFNLTIPTSWYDSNDTNQNSVTLQSNYSFALVLGAYCQAVRQYNIDLHQNCSGNCFTPAFIAKFKTLVKNVDLAYYEYIDYILKRDGKWCCQEPSQLAHMYMLIASTILNDLRWNIVHS